MTAAAGAVTPEEPGSSFRVLWRGLTLSPAYGRKRWTAATLVLLTMAGRIVPPITIQQVIDRGIGGPGAVDTAFSLRMILLAVAAVVLTTVSSYVVSIRLCRNAEAGLADTRLMTFAHIHRLPVLHHQAELRGALVSRVTSDVDAITKFVQYSGMRFVMSVVQVVAATSVMVLYSWQLTLLVWAVFVSFLALLAIMQGWIKRQFRQIRSSVAAMLAAVSESLLGIVTIRVNGVEERLAVGVHRAIDETREAQLKGQRLTTGTLGIGELMPGAVSIGLVLGGVSLILAGDLTAGRLVAMLFLVSLFVTPVQVGVETLNDAQNAVACWRRILGVLNLRTGLVDPEQDDPEPWSRGGGVRFNGVSFAYQGGRAVLSKVDVAVPRGARAVVVGETGSGKSTFAKLAARFMDPDTGAVTLDGRDLRLIPFSTLRKKIVLVPQEGFLFNTTIAENVRYGVPDASPQAISDAFRELGLDDWLAAQRGGINATVGQRGEYLSAGERQLVALARAHIADPDVLILDEATSDLDPMTEMRIATALERLTRGRTSITIAHRMSTAEWADEVLVFDGGRIVERGPHRALVDLGGVYATLHSAWSDR